MWANAPTRPSEMCAGATAAADAYAVIVAALSPAATAAAATAPNDLVRSTLLGACWCSCWRVAGGGGGAHSPPVRVM